MGLDLENETLVYNSVIHIAVGHHEDGLDAQRHARHHRRRVTQRRRECLPRTGKLVFWCRVCPKVVSIWSLTSISLQTEAPLLVKPFLAVMTK